MKISEFAEPQKTRTRNKKFFEGMGEINFSRSLGAGDRISFYRDLAMALSAGADISQAVLYLDDGSKKKRNVVFREVHENLMNGLSLSEALKLTRQFDTFECVSIEVGENTGRLTDVLNRLSGTLERSRDLRRQLISISIYPVLLVALTFGVLVFMLFFVVPTFEDLYQRFDTELPALTKFILKLSGMVNVYTIGISTILAVGIGIYIYTKRESDGVRKTQYYLFSRIPVFGILWKENILSQYFDFFALMVSSGIPINSAMAYLGELTYAYPLREETRVIGRDIEKGKSLHIAIGESSFFNPGIVSLVKIGEESNSLSAVFENLREQYSKKSEFSLKTFGAALEPVLIIVIAAIVAVILLAMYLPIFEFSSGI